MVSFRSRYRRAMRTAADWLHGDHLGSASWRRIGAVTALTERTFTGQALDSRTGLMYYRARWYDPRLGRFIQADTVVPEPGNPQALNRYAYVAGNPVRYNDPSGHCPWCIGAAIGAAVGAVVGAASAAAPQMIQNVRDGQPLTANIDPGEVGKAFVTGLVAGAVVGGTLGWGASALGLVGAGEGGTALVSSATVVEVGATAEAVATAACADGDCTNEISTLTQADLSAVQRFAQEAVEINSARGMQSFGSTWEWLSRSMLQLGNQSRMFIARAGERITDMMQVRYTAEGYVIEKLEGLGGGAGTALFKQAIQDSIAKGYGGSISLLPATQAVGFYAQFPGYQILPNGMWYWSAEAAQAILGH